MKVLNGLVVALVVCPLAGIGGFGCNTVSGAGKDIQQGGHAVQNAADNAQVRDREVVRHQQRTHAIMASSEAGGSISPSGSTDVSYGSNRTFAINAYSGYHVADVLVDGQSVGAVTRHTFDNVTVSHTISASFAANASR